MLTQTCTLKKIKLHHYIEVENSIILRFELMQLAKKNYFVDVQC